MANNDLSSWQKYMVALFYIFTCRYVPVRIKSLGNYKNISVIQVLQIRITTFMEVLTYSPIRIDTLADAK